MRGVHDARELGMMHGRIPAPGSEDFGCPGVSEWQPGEGWALLALLLAVVFLWWTPVFRYCVQRSRGAGA